LVPIQPLPDIGPEAMTAAVEAAGYFAEHARRMYAMSVPDIVATRALAAKLIAGEELDGKTIRYIYRKRWAGLTTPADVGEAVENLRDAGWLKIGSAPSTTRGRPAVTITVSPKRDRFKMEAHPGDEATAVVPATVAHPGDEPATTTGAGNGGGPPATTPPPPSPWLATVAHR
jgi:hypothetical protein